MKSKGFQAEAVEIRILLAMISRISTHGLERWLMSYGFGSALQHIVMCLLSHQEHTISELSRKLMLEPATLVPVVDALERDGYVIRSQDLKDRRRTPILLTECGLALLARVPTVDDTDILVSSLHAMGDRKSHQLLVLLHELAAHISKNNQAVADIASTMQQHFVSQHSVAEEDEAG